MLKGVYSFKNLDLDIAQAYIAIVLDYHSQYKAAERVLNFYKYVSSDGFSFNLDEINPDEYASNSFIMMISKMVGIIIKELLFGHQKVLNGFY